MCLKFIPLILVLFFFCTIPKISMAKTPLTLEISITKAKQLSLRMNVEKHNIHAHSADIKKAQADTLPTIHLTSDYERLSGVNTLLNSVDLSWDASAFAKDPGKSRSLLLKAAEEKKSMAESFLVYQVKEGYYRLMQLKQRLIVLQKGLNLLNQQRAITEQFVASGLKQVSALSRIDDQINSIKTTILFKKGSIAQTRSALLQLINIPDSAGEKFADYDGNLTPLPERSQVLAKVLQNAPNIQSMIFEQHAVAETVHSPWMDLLPVVSLSAGYQQEWPISNDGFDIHLVFSVPIMDMGKARSYNARNASLAAKKQAEIRQKSKELVDQVSILYEKAELNKSLFLTYRKNNVHRQETLRLIHREYESGLISESDLINSQRDTIDAVFKMEKAFYDYMTIVAKIEYCQGAVQ